MQRVSSEELARHCAPGSTSHPFETRNFALDLRDARAEVARLSALLDAVRPVVVASVARRADEPWEHPGWCECDMCAAVDALPADAHEWAKEGG